MTIKKCKNMTENSAKDFKKCTINLLLEEVSFIKRFPVIIIIIKYPNFI